jgi:hypothetical protein
MTGLPVNSASHRCVAGRYPAARLLENLPAWMADEIRTESLSVCDWECAEGDAIPAWRARFPGSRVVGVDGVAESIRKARDQFGSQSFVCHDLAAAPLQGPFDLVAGVEVLQNYEEPWTVLRTVALNASRHLLLVVPWGEGGFGEATLATQIEPDFELSSCKGLDEGRMLLVYSRARYFPRERAVFQMPVETRVDERVDVLAVELAKARTLLEIREAELRSSAAREAEIRSHADYWQEKVAAVTKQMEEISAGKKWLYQEYAKVSAEHQAQASMANAAAAENAALRRTVAELQSSLSWKVTAPLRWVTRPLFRALAAKEEARRDTPRQVAEGSTSSSAPSSAAERIESIVVPELRHGHPLAVITCALPFSSTLNHRPISFARYFADRGYTVLFVEIWGTREEQRHAAGEEVYPRTFAVPLEDFQANLDVITQAARGKRSYLCTIPYRGAAELIRPLRADGYHIHYDIMDDWEEFHRGDEAYWYAADVERQIVNGSDTITSVSEKLVGKFAPLRGDIEVVRNGYQPSALACEQFIAARTPLERKIVGYFGHFSDGWFDWDTVLHAARALPEVEFELIGWGLSESARVRLLKHPNVRFEGLVPQNNLHRYARKWWAGMIPFSPSTLSAAVDPLKIYEYLHLGLNSVVTGISGIAHYPMVHYVEGREAFVEALRRLPDRPDERSLAAASEFLKNCVWEARLARLESLIGSPPGRASVYAR